jgi:DNA-binding response OmpR family regulator
MNILLVEDDPRIADFLSRGLRAEGHRVEVAVTGLEGLEMVRKATRERPGHGAAHVLILDLMLPGMNGLEICQTLRAEGYALPILMLSALGAVEDRVAGLRLGADDYLSKPFDFEELLARLDSLGRRLGRGFAPALPAKLVVGDLVFDRERMQASRANRVLVLTARELALLELMMSAPGRLFSRERILSHVWGASEDPLTNVVDVYIRRLRSKIDEEHATQLIHTVRGLGYRLESAPQPNHAH